MTITYHTLNPIGSTAPKDLSDNASAIDEFATSSAPSAYDRFMRRGETLAGLRKQVHDFIEAMGFEATHLQYVDGSPLTVLRSTQLVDRAGSVYKVKQPAVFPVSLTGTWATDQLLLVDVGDASLRSELAAPPGASIVGALDKDGLPSTVQAELDANRPGDAFVRNLIDDFGAVGNGIADDTAAVQAAVNWAASTGSYLRVPSGIFKLTAPVNIPNSFRMVGDGFDTSYRRAMGAQTRYGSYFYIAHSGKGFVQTSVTTGQPNTNCLTFRDFATIRDQPIPINSSFAPINHDWDFYIAGYGACELDNVCALNATRAFYVEQRCVLNNLKGQAFASFIEVDKNYDVARVTNCHQWPYWDETIWAMDYTRANSVAYAFYRADNAMLSNNFSYAHHYGLLLAIRDGGVPSRLKSSGLDLDAGAYGIVNTAPGSTAVFDNTSCTAWTGVAVGNGIFSSAVGATMEFRGLILSNIPEQGIYLDGNNNRIAVQDLWVEGWNKANTSKPAVSCVTPAQFSSSNEIRALPSSGNGAEILNGNGSFKVPLGKGFASAVTSDGSGNVVITHGLIADPKEIFLQCYNQGTIAITIVAHNATTFTVRVFNPATGAALPSTLFGFSWSADYYLPLDAGV